MASPETPAAAASSESSAAAPGSAVQDMLTKIAAFVEGEAEMSLEDYRLLEAMNLTAAEQYSSMAEYSAGLVAFAERLQSKCDELLPQLAQASRNQCLRSSSCTESSHVALRLMHSRHRSASSKELSSSSMATRGG